MWFALAWCDLGWLGLHWFVLVWLGLDLLHLNSTTWQCCSHHVSTRWQVSLQYLDQQTTQPCAAANFLILRFLKRTGKSKKDSLWPKHTNPNTNKVHLCLLQHHIIKCFPMGLQPFHQGSNHHHHHHYHPPPLFGMFQ